MIKTQHSVANAATLLDHMCHLDYSRELKYRRMASICATLGPSCQSVDKIYEMIKAGMTIARINFSHGSHQEHDVSIDCLHKAVERYSKDQGYNCHVAIAGDLKGREIRTGFLAGKKPVELNRGDVFKLSINTDLSNKCTKELIFIDYPQIIKEVTAGQRIAINDNSIVAEVTEVGVDCLLCQVLVGGYFSNKANVVLPGIELSLPVISDKDAADIKYSIDHNFDILFLSKLRTDKDVLTVRNKIKKIGKNIRIITKLENAQGLANCDSIIAASDGVFFARADICVELKLSRVFLAQKAILARCDRMTKPVICGTQFLMSMIDNPVPKRVDVSDIANALVDGADCLLLSSETAIGQYPIEAIKALAHTCKDAEAAIWHRHLFEDLISRNPAAVDGAHAMAISAVSASINIMATAIIVITVSGKSAQLLSMYRPRCPIFAVTRCPRVARQVNICRGIIPILAPMGERDAIRAQDIETRINYALSIGNRMNLIHTGDAIVVLSPWKHMSGYANNVNVIYAYFERNVVDCAIERDSRRDERLLSRRSYK